MLWEDLCASAKVSQPAGRHSSPETWGIIQECMWERTLFTAWVPAARGDWFLGADLMGTSQAAPLGGQKVKHLVLDPLGNPTARLLLGLGERHLLFAHCRQNKVCLKV